MERAVDVEKAEEERKVMVVDGRWKSTRKKRMSNCVARSSELERDGMWKE